MRQRVGDPFNELPRSRFRRRITVLGCGVLFDSNQRGLLRLAEQAFAGLPARRIVSSAPRLQVHLRLLAHDRPFPAGGPPRPVMTSGGGLLSASIDAANFALLAPAAGVALVSTSASMMRFPYLLRYELIEFAVLTLAARARGLMPLHAACIGARGRGVLLLGASGTGKSTLAIQALEHGLDYLAEDAVFVDASLRADAVPAFLHARCDSRDAVVARIARHAAVIRRRSGVRKFEIDLRRSRARIARAPLALAAVVVLSARRGGRGRTLRELSGTRMLRALERDQPYAAATVEWRAFRRRLQALPAYELRRGAHPRDSALAIRALLETPPRVRPTRA